MEAGRLDKMKVDQLIEGLDYSLNQYLQDKG